MNEIAATIVQQLGGIKLLRLMLGTRQVLYNETGICFDMAGCSRVNRIQIKYDKGEDTYQVKFLKYRFVGPALILVAEYTDIYCDQLRDLIESETGLYLRPIHIQRLS